LAAKALGQLVERVSGEWQVSEVVELPGKDGKKTYQVILVKDRKEQMVKSFDEVKAAVEKLALAAKRAKVAAEWIAQLKKETPIENKIDEVIKSLTPKKEEPATQQAAPEGEKTESAGQQPAGNQPAAPAEKK